MATVKHSNWTLLVTGEFCLIRKYTTTTHLRGDDARHGGTEQVMSFTSSLDELPNVIREHDIKEFTDDEGMSWLLMQPKDT